MIGQFQSLASFRSGVWMDFAFSAEQEEFRSSVRRFLDDKSPSSKVREIMETEFGIDYQLWDQMVDQLGLVALAIPEKYGGSGFGLTEVGIVFEELGRALVCAPYFSTVALGVNMILASEDEAACREYLPKVASGEITLAVCSVENINDWSLDTLTTVALGGEEAYISGTKKYVVDGLSASHLLVLANTEHLGPSLYLVRSDAEGINKYGLSTLDQTRKLADLEFNSAPAQLIGKIGAGAKYYERMLHKALTCISAEQVGGAQKVLEMAVGYSKQRSQFGRPIGSFQAIKHKCAEMLVEIESAKSASYYACWASDNQESDLPVAAFVAKSYCSDAYLNAAAENIQIHGGIGFTWEHDCHLYFKRAKASGLMFGAPEYFRERLALLIGL